MYIYIYTNTYIYKDAHEDEFGYKHGPAELMPFPFDGAK